MDDEARPDAPASDVAFTAVARGRVQGVGFRDFTRRTARPLGVSGWVRNGDDGRSVEVHASGSRAALEALLDQLRDGPRFAYVTELNVEWLERAEPGSGFTIRY